jgi:hypothetical protein
VGQTAQDTQREVTALRADLSSVVDELMRRTSGGPTSIATTDAKVRGAQLGQDVRTRVERVSRKRPEAIVVGVGAASMAIAYSIASAIQRRNRPEEKLKRGVAQARERAESQIEDLAEQAREVASRIRETGKRGVLLKVESEKSGELRVKKARLDVPSSKEGAGNELLKKLLWAGVLSLFLAVAGVTARRAAGAVWKMTLNEDPPTERE